MSITYNIDKQLLDASGLSARGVCLIYCARGFISLQFTNNDGEPVNLSDASSWSAAVDIDYNTATALVCRSDDTMIDSSRSASGMLDIQYDTATQQYLAALNGKESVIGIFEIRGYNSSAQCIYCFQFKGTLLMSIDPAADPVPAVAANYYTKSETAAILNSQNTVEYSSDSGATWTQTAPATVWKRRYKNSALPNAQWTAEPLIPGCSATVQYSADGSTNWHTALTDSDNYMRVSTDDGTTWTTAYQLRLNGQSVNVSSLTDGKLAVPLTSIPVFVKTGYSNLYPIEKGSITASASAYLIDPAPYLTYDGAATFSGTWTVFLAAGSDDSKGQAVLSLAGTSVPANTDRLIYIHTIAANDAFTFGTPSGGYAPCFRMWLAMPSTAVSFTFPNNVHWVNGVTPNFSIGGKLYCVVFEWCSALNKWRANLEEEAITL